MEKKSDKVIIFWAIALSLLANIFFSRWLTAKVSTWPLLNRLKLLDPQSPIVIRETRETRVSPEGEIGAALENINARVSKAGVNSKDGFKVLSGAVNFTSDGIFVTSGLAVAGKPANLQILFPDGKTADVLDTFADKNSGLIFLKTKSSGIAAASLLNSDKLKLGDRLLAFNFADAGLSYFETQVNFLPRGAGAFGFQNSGVDTAPGTVFANYKGEVAGIWHDRLIMPEEIVKAFDNYLQNERNSNK